MVSGHLQLKHSKLRFSHLQLYHLQQVTSSKTGPVPTCTEHLQLNTPLAATICSKIDHLQRKKPLAAKSVIL